MTYLDAISTSNSYLILTINNIKKNKLEYYKNLMVVNKLLKDNGVDKLQY
jgi:hypothetical protein